MRLKSEGRDGPIVRALVFEFEEVEKEVLEKDNNCDNWWWKRGVHTVKCRSGC